jgi:hypothetical protein
MAELEKGKSIPDDWENDVWDCELCSNCCTALNKFLAGEAIPAIAQEKT